MNKPRAFLHGIHYAPGDCNALELALVEKLIVPDIPLYRGILPNKLRKMEPQALRAHEEELAEITAQELIEQDCFDFIAISRSSLYSILVARAFQRLGKRVNSIVMVPAAADPKEIQLANGPEAKDVMDGVLLPMRGRMAESVYNDMKVRHEKTFIAALKAVDPKKHPVSPEEAHDLLQEVDESTRILILDLLRDPYRHLERLARIFGKRKNVFITNPAIDASHMPYLECPEPMANIIKSFDDIENLPEGITEFQSSVA